ncbi:unnamed protein product [Rotaria sordida]|uniref:Aminopeptidase n=5 Tax=Rotaria sordida TaxID=392033 RepID=A0A815SFW0_9BILA|nr:unnamed protein product [Rotaria sordida]
MKLIIAGIGITIIITIAILALAIATLVKVNNQTNDRPYVDTSSTTTTPRNLVLAESIRIDDVMNYLKELQRIATANNGNRAVTTTGFNETLRYIINTLAINTNYKVSTQFFPIRQFALDGIPTLISSINGVSKNYIYSTNLAAADFYHIQFSIGANFPNFMPLTAIPNVGCSDADWRNANPSPGGRVALVKRGICAFEEKGALAAKYNVSALLIYNDGATPDRVSPIAVGLGQENYLPALFLSSSVGQELVNAAQNTSTNAGVRIIIQVKDLPLSPIGNICADTPTGDITQTIVVGSHSDSVPAGPGINDNGSGSTANLGLAIALARLFNNSNYAKYKYRVRFCWWGAEEIGLLGADYHVKQAKISNVTGERLTDYLINLNYDMLGSPNYIFGIYDGRTANNDTPVHALPGSNKITAVYREWFDQQKLPSTYTDFSGRSDYGPFLAEGIVAGGLFSGGDDVKSAEERNYYDQMLGQGLGGIAGAIHDPCYHQACDSIQNINVFVYEKMVQAAAYVLEYLARQDDLKQWLYPEGRPLGVKNQQSQRKYNSINEYFRMPYS